MPNEGPESAKYADAAELQLMVGFPPPPEKRVNKTNALLTPPFNRWAYQNMRTMYPSAPIAAAAAPIPVEREIDPAIAGLKIAEPGNSEPADLGTYLKKTYSDALVVVHGDRIVHETYLNGMSAEQPHQMMSCTKSFGGLLALMAIHDGAMSEDDPVTKYVPELKAASAFAVATVGQVLDMTNSMAFTEIYDDPRSGVRQYGAVLGWTDRVPGVEYADNLYDYLVTLEKEPGLPHGEIFHYQTPKTDVVNWVTNRVMNQTFRQGMHERLWSRLGTAGETYVLLDNNGTLVAGGGLNASPENLVRFARMMINDGKCAGQQVVAPEVISTIANGGSVAAYDAGPESNTPIHPKGEWSYRAQWWVKHTDGLRAFMAIGINGQWVYMDPARKVAIVKLSSQPISKDDYLNGFDLNAFYAIARHFN